MGGYFKWATTDKIPLVLDLVDPGSGAGVPAKTPEVSIRRNRASEGGAALDDYFWTGSAFTATPTWLTIPEYDATNNPGAYLYLFDQTLVGLSIIYVVRYRHTVFPVGIETETHVVTDEIYVPASSPVIVTLPGDTVMQRLSKTLKRNDFIALK